MTRRTQHTLTVAVFSAAALVLALGDRTEAGGPYYYAPPSYYVQAPVVVYDPVFVMPTPVVVHRPVVTTYYTAPAPVMAPVTPVYAAPPVGALPYRAETFGRYHRYEYRTYTPYGVHKYKVRYDLRDGDVRVRHDFDD